MRDHTEDIVMVFSIFGFVLALVGLVFAVVAIFLAAPDPASAGELSSLRLWHYVG